MGGLIVQKSDNSGEEAVLTSGYIFLTSTLVRRDQVSLSVTWMPRNLLWAECSYD